MRQNRKKHRSYRYKTMLNMRIGNAAIRRQLKKHLKRTGDQFLMVCWTKKGLSDGAFDNLPHVLFDRVSVRKALRLARYYVYWPRFHQQWFPLLPSDEQQKYWGWAERITKSTYIRMVNGGIKRE